VIGVWYLVFGVWCLVFGVWFFVFRVQDSGRPTTTHVWCLVFGVWCFGFRVQDSGRPTRFRGGLVFKAHRLLHHSTLGLKAMKKNNEGDTPVERASPSHAGAAPPPQLPPPRNSASSLPCPSSRMQEPSPLLRPARVYPA